LGIVRFALKYPHTFYVLATLILFLGVTAAVEMPTDIFPEINIPVVSVIWQYTGLDTTEMEQRVTTYSQYSISSNVNGIKDIEAETVNGISVQKIYFQPDVNLDLAISQIVAATNAIRALMPTGIEPPVVVQYSASAVPVLQISLSSGTLNESQLYDYGIYKLRQMIAPIHGVTLPTPAGGKYRQIMVDIDQTKLGLSYAKVRKATSRYTETRGNPPIMPVFIPQFTLSNSAWFSRGCHLPKKKCLPPSTEVGVPKTLELGTTVRRAGIRGKMRKIMFLNCVLKPVFRFDPERGFPE